MYYSKIKKYDIANGLGIRTVLFVSGCRNHCEGCFQPETWLFDYGQPFTKETEDEIIESIEPSYVRGLTLLGGEPFEPENQAVLVPFMKRFKEKCPGKDVWAFTGYTLDKDLIPGGRKYIQYTDDLLYTIDVLVDGQFIEELKDITLKFRGSSNQRVIDVPHFMETGDVAELM